MFRTRFKRDIIAEFLPPARSCRKQKVIILCDGMPSIPKKQPLVEFLSGKGYWAFYPRWRGAWESGGQLLQKSPHQDILDIVDELPRGVTETAFGKRFKISPDAIYVIGGSFGGTAALLASLDKRIQKVVANCPVVDWSIVKAEQKKETSNPSYAAYIREAFGNGYRLSERNWNKLRSGTFFNPIYHVGGFAPSKIMMFHAKDDPYVPWRTVDRFARQTGVKLKMLPRGGHLSTSATVPQYWAEIKKFLERVS
jgi:alpha-beta hydrolase superfamily lysophospholipase